jgi:GTPase
MATRWSTCPTPTSAFLEGRFRKAFDLVGTPLRIEFKTSSNPYKE